MSPLVLLLALSARGGLPRPPCHASWAQFRGTHQAAGPKAAGTTPISRTSRAVRTGRGRRAGPRRWTKGLGSGGRRTSSGQPRLKIGGRGTAQPTTRTATRARAARPWSMAATSSPRKCTRSAARSPLASAGAVRSGSARTTGSPAPAKARTASTSAAARIPPSRASTRRTITRNAPRRAHRT